MNDEMDLEEAMVLESDKYLKQYDGQIFDASMRQKIMTDLIDIHEKYFAVRIQKILKKAFKDVFGLDMPDVIV